MVRNRLVFEKLLWSRGNSNMSTPRTASLLHLFSGREVDLITTVISVGGVTLSDDFVARWLTSSSLPMIHQLQSPFSIHTCGIMAVPTRVIQQYLPMLPCEQRRSRYKKSVAAPSTCHSPTHSPVHLHQQRSTVHFTAFQSLRHNTQLPRSTSCLQSSHSWPSSSSSSTG